MSIKKTSIPIPNGTAEVSSLENKLMIKQYIKRVTKPMDGSLNNSIIYTTKKAAKISIIGPASVVIVRMLMPKEIAKPRTARINVRFVLDKEDKNSIIAANRIWSY